MHRAQFRFEAQRAGTVTEPVVGRKASLGSFARIEDEVTIYSLEGAATVCDCLAIGTTQKVRASDL